MELMFQPFRKYADFSGRASRAEYWLFILFVVVVSIILRFINFGTGLVPIPFIDLDILSLIFWLIIFNPNLAVSVRRLHDRNLSGWLVLIGLVSAVVGNLIPLIGWMIALAGSLVMVVLFLLPGTAGKNRFGNKP